MGPRMGIRGKSRLNLTRSAPSSCFNGAADGDPRKDAEEAKSRVPFTELQWGRGWGSAERYQQSSDRRSLAAASMGPRMGIRGKECA